MVCGANWPIEDWKDGHITIDVTLANLPRVSDEDMLDLIGPHVFKKIKTSFLTQEEIEKLRQMIDAWDFKKRISEHRPEPTP